MSDWRHQAICRDEDAELFFPLGGDNSYVKDSAAYLAAAEKPKAVCRRCPVVSDCLAWALESGQDHGIHGGMTAYERRVLRRSTGRTKRRAA